MRKVKKKYQDTPTLYFNKGKEHKDAYLLLLSSQIPCTFRAPSSDEQPTLLIGFRRYVGLRKIKRFIEEEKIKLK